MPDTLHQADHQGLETFLATIEVGFKQAVAKTLNKVGSEIMRGVKEDLVRSIRDQTLNWTPLNPNYKERKRRLKLDTRTLIATGNYYRSIRFRKADEQELSQTWVVDTPNTRIAPSALNPNPGDLTYAKLAMIHEYGAGSIPPRPHWLPATVKFQKSKEKYTAKINREFTKNLAATIGSGFI